MCVCVYWIHNDDYDQDDDGDEGTNWTTFEEEEEKNNEKIQTFRYNRLCYISMVVWKQTAKKSSQFLCHWYWYVLTCFLREIHHCR